MKKPVWRSLLEGAIAKEATEAAEGVVAEAERSRRRRRRGTRSRSDSSLAGGAAGLGHVFNRFYQASGDATLRRAALFWFERTLAMRQPGRGVGGFQALTARADGTKYWDDDPGILIGAAGVALALLAATTSIEPAWDRMLLVSTPLRG